MDAAISQIVSITNTTPERAAQYVTLADGDADRAIELFFDYGGADLGGDSTSSAAAAVPSSSSHVPSSGHAHDPIDVDDEGPGRPGVEDDAAMARRMQEEMYRGGGEDVRAPIARQAETLVGAGADLNDRLPPNFDPAIEERMLELQGRRGRGFQPGIFNQRPATSAIWNEDSERARSTFAEATGGASEASSKSNTLARLFQPPWDIMYKGSWEDAREDGKENQKWLLVNIQDGSVFDCQLLNRDLWKNPSVVDTVKENFIFLQYSKDDVRAEQYIQYYFTQYANHDMYPHIAIVDPRTGEQIKVWSREVPRPADFLMQLHEFLDRYSLDHAARNPVAKRKSEAKQEKTVDQMTEDEMLERALQASLTNQSTSLAAPGVEDPDELTRSIGDLRDTATTNGTAGLATASDQNGDPSASASQFSLISSSHPHTEPEPGPNVTRIQIRHPGGRLVRRFTISDPVRRIYEFLKAEPLEGKAGVEFELVALGKNLMGTIDETIEQAGLKQASIMVEFLEE